MLKKRGSLLIIVFVIGFFILFSRVAKAQTTTIPSQTSDAPLHSSKDIILEKLLQFFFGIGEIRSSVSLKNFTLTKPPQTYNGFVYYPQAGGDFDDYPLPNGSTLKKAGCGPTTVAMILSSFVNSQFIPPVVVELYREKGYYLGDLGSSYQDAKALFESYGLQTSATQFYNNVRIDDIAWELKNYIRAGWTLFAQGNYLCSSDPSGFCSHYFWIIDIDDNNNVISLDSYYGRNSIPLNQNTYYPFPTYQLVFGIKKP